MDGSTLINSRRSGPSAASPRLVDVIIPVYSGLAEVRACLESLLSSSSESQGEVIVINDCSPEPAIEAFLRGLERESRITLLENDENLGFVKSCNRAAALRPANDFVLLNADTEVNGDWLDRLVAHATAASEVGSITPFSNNATIASYPWGGAARATAGDIPVAEIDDAMSIANKGQSVSLPTAIGFCMWVSRDAWQQVGGFDERYGRGYGEEVEFCLATAAKGWRHLLACDVFVYHAGNISFGSGAEHLKIEAQKLVDERYPEFSAGVQDWIRKDPALNARVNCDLKRLNLGNAPKILHVSHNMGGGVAQHVEELATACREQTGCTSFLLAPVGDEGLSFRAMHSGFEICVSLAADKAEEKFCDLFCALEFQRIHFHHYIGLPQWVLSLPERMEVPYSVTIHDFVTINPNCHYPYGREVVDPADQKQWGLKVAEWRTIFLDHLSQAEKVICPTSFAAEVLSDFYPNVQCTVWPHLEVRNEVFGEHLRKAPSRLKVAIVGGLSRLKGFDFVASVIKQAETSELPLDFVIIGSTEGKLHQSTKALVTGPFELDSLAAIFLRERPDCFLFASEAPETYSYALSTCIAAGLPIVAVDTGAFKERLSGLKRARLYPAQSKVEYVLDLLSEIDQRYVLSTEANADVIDSVGTSPDVYVSQYLAAMPAPEPLRLDKVKAALSVIAGLDRPSSPSLPTLEALLDAALDQRLIQAQYALRNHTLNAQAILREREQHLEIRASEVSHLKGTIEDLQAAFTREENHLKSEISALQASKEHDVQHLKAWQARVRELEGSTLWRMMAPVRWMLHRIKLCLRPGLKVVRLIRKGLLFCRYHFAMGGWRGLSVATGRRLKRLQHRQALKRPTPDSLESIVPDLLKPPLALETCSDPALTIVIPCYGQHEVTAQCLQSIASFPPSVPYEVLVADDAFATPFDPAQFGLTGLTVLRAEENQGFLRNCNAAVSKSAGDRVLLLNNDTMVLEGAVDALWQTFERFEGVGAVGAKLLYPNGRLQEAGGIIWQDGSGWNWGRDENADAPRFNYVRDADYCSAAALMVDKTLWDSVGGFDARFAPCYYEDTDLCFAIRLQGKRVLYQPAAEILHFEGVTHGTDVAEGAKAYQARNQVTFVQKWRGALDSHAPNGERPLREAERGVRVRILWLEACVITPDQDSGSLRTLRLLRLLLKLGCKVTFAADNLLSDEPYGQQLRDEGIEVLHAPHVNSMGEYLRDHGGHYDVVTLCRHYIAIQHVDLLREHHPSTQIWFDTIDLHYLRLRRQHELDQAPATLKMAELAHREECEVISKSDLTIVVSEVEVAELANEAPDAKVAIISNIHEVAHDRPGFDDRTGVMFVGGFQHPPNIDAVEYYAREIWPLLTELCPDLETYIIGSRMPDRLKKLGESKGLKMLGFVEDLTPYYESCKLAIAPLRYGAGVKGKVNQALSYGLPVVGSPDAFEGMGLTHEREVMVAETPEGFADSIAKVCNNRALWQALSEKGGASLAGRFTPEVAQEALRNALAPWLDERDLETVG